MPNNALCGAHEARVLFAGCMQHQAIGSGLLLSIKTDPFIRSCMAHLKYNKKKKKTFHSALQLKSNFLIPFKFKTPPEPSHIHLISISYPLPHPPLFPYAPKQTLFRYYLGRVFGQLSEFLLLSDSTAFDTADLSLLKTL